MSLFRDADTRSPAGGSAQAALLPQRGRAALPHGSVPAGDNPLRTRGSSSTSRPGPGEAAPPRPALPPLTAGTASRPAPERAARARLFRGPWVRHERRGGADAERPARAAGAARLGRGPGRRWRPRQGVGLLPAREPHQEHHGAHLQARTGCGAVLLSLPAPGEPALGWTGLGARARRVGLSSGAHDNPLR